MTTKSLTGQGFKNPRRRQSPPFPMIHYCDFQSINLSPSARRASTAAINLWFPQIVPATARAGKLLGYKIDEHPCLAGAGRARRSCRHQPLWRVACLHRQLGRLGALCTLVRENGLETSLLLKKIGRPAKRTRRQSVSAHGRTGRQGRLKCWRNNY